MDGLEVFKKLRDTCAEVVDALESEDAEKTETALGKFMLLMAQLDCLK